MKRVAIVDQNLWSHEAYYSSAPWIRAALQGMGYEVQIFPYTEKSAWSALLRWKPDIVFPQTLGSYGEDGTLAALLEYYDLPYVGSSVTASALGMQKHLFSLCVQGIAPRLPVNIRVTAPFSLLIEEKDAATYEQIAAQLGPIFVLKPNSARASFGVEKVTNREQFQIAIGRARQKVFFPLLAEEYVAGTECTVGVIEDGFSAYDLPVCEIALQEGMYTLQKKVDQRTTYRIPARLDAWYTSQLQKALRLIYHHVGCRSFARFDVILGGSCAYILEMNTLPGLIPHLSCFPKLCQHAGISYEQMITMLLQSASLRRGQRKLTQEEVPASPFQPEDLPGAE